VPSIAIPRGRELLRGAHAALPAAAGVVAWGLDRVAREGEFAYRGAWFLGTCGLVWLVWLVWQVTSIIGIVAAPIAVVARDLPLGLGLVAASSSACS
jgi:hypothetical protein